MKIRKINWEKFGEMVNKLAEKIEGKFDGIYGMPRGGLPLAVCLSHKMNIPLLLNPSLKSLVVDDISDYGHTLTNYRNRKIATLFSTDWTVTPPNWFVDKKLNQEEWIQFPWEK